jgi:beta-lactam-binding protein with PASTA domain
MSRETFDDGVTDDRVTERVDVERVEVDADPVVAVPPSGVAGPAVLPGDEIEEELAPGHVVERESLERREDGSVERRLDRVEHAPVRRRRRLFDLGPVLLLILVLALGAIAAAWYFTRADEQPVPNVVGLQVDEAVAQLQADEFQTNISRQPDAQPEGVVVSQTPAGGTELEEGSTVAVVASSGPGLVAVPNAIGLTEAEARDRLAAAGFTVTVVEVFSTKPAGTIVAQNPAAAEELEPGSTIRLNVSKGAASIPVPNTVGQQAVDAQQLLTNAGFEVNIVDVPSIEAAGVVVAQNPTGGEAPSGSSVRLNVSNGELPAG